MKRTEKKEKAKGITWDEVEILVVGGGTMGSSIAQAFAQSGFNAAILDISDDILKRAMSTISKELEAAVRGGIFSPSQVEEVKRRILATTSYEEACRGKSLKLVIESATENIEIKKKIFRKLDELCAPHVIFASNSSSLDVNILARETKRPDKVVWTHFFYLPHKNRAAEYAGTDTASPESIEIAARYMKLAGKVATPILNSRKGGAADVIFVALLLEAARMVDEGYDIPTIEAAGRKTFNMPLGFLGLMDATGLPLGLYTMYSFSDSSSPGDPLYKAYGNFYTPAESYKKLVDKYQKAEDKSAVKWVAEDEAKKEAKDLMLVDMLKNRFLAVGFMTAVEVVEAGVIEMEDVDKLCQNAFLWREGPFALMNKMGINEVLRIVTEKMELSHRKEINFPIPKLLISQAQKGEPWPLKLSSVLYRLEQKGRVARVIISNPQSANSLDNQVFDDLRASFRKANEDKSVQVIIFDSAPIKTFIAGANVPYFIRRIRENKFQELKEDVACWHYVLFHEMTGCGKPKVAIVDGAAFGGGVEVALAFAFDPDSVVIITDRTSFAFPETRLGIYPGMRGTLLLPQLIYKATGDAELAVALTRYYILAGGTATSSPRMIKYLRLADFLVPARKRDEAAEVVVEAVMKNGGKALRAEQLRTLKIEELPSELTFEEKEEIRWMKDLFLKPDLVPTLYAYGRGQTEFFLSGESKEYAQRIARRVANNSLHAVFMADLLISRGFDGFLKGQSMDELARWELENYLLLFFRHPDALEGLTALVERRFPEFKRRYPF